MQSVHLKKTHEALKASAGTPGKKQFASRRGSPTIFGDEDKNRKHRLYKRVRSPKGQHGPTWAVRLCVCVSVLLLRCFCILASVSVSLCICVSCVCLSVHMGPHSGVGEKRGIVKHPDVSGCVLLCCVFVSWSWCLSLCLRVSVYLCVCVPLIQRR